MTTRPELQALIAEHDVALRAGANAEDDDAAAHARFHRAHEALMEARPTDPAVLALLLR
jgi:hypothetical protein